MAKDYENADWTDTLAQVPLFADLPRRHVKAIAKMGKIQTWEPQSAIVRVGAEGDAFYLLLEGSASVRRQGRRSVSLGVGDYFGELALLADVPRTATVLTTDRCMTMRIGRKDFTAMLKRDPKIAVVLLRTVATRLSTTMSGEV
jgi:CRP/FNR family transcriptional regulator, cyclic AMP receptor protein